MLGMVDKLEQDRRRATARATAPAWRASPTCRPARQTGYAAVIDWHGLRLGTAPFAHAGERRRARRDPRARAHRGSVGDHHRRRRPRRRADARGHAAVPGVPAAREHARTRCSTPAPGAFEIPLPDGLRRRAQPQENERKIEVRQNHGIAVHGPIVAQRSQLGGQRQERQANEVVVRFRAALPWRHARVLTAAAERHRAAHADHRAEVAGLTVSGPGIGAREERELGGRKYWVMPIDAIAPGGDAAVHAQRAAVDRFQGRIVRGRPVAAAGRRRRSCSAAGRATGGAGKRRRPPTNGRGWSSSASRCSPSWSRWSAPRASAGAAAPADRRKQLVARLEQVYQRLAALDEHRAA